MGGEGEEAGEVKLVLEGVGLASAPLTVGSGLDVAIVRGVSA